MDYVRLGRTNLMPSRIALDAVSLSKIGDAEKAAELILKAYGRGINFFDASRFRPESEQILGEAVRNIRASVMISTKTSAESSAEILSDIETSLNSMRTDFIDIYQYEAGRFLPELNGQDGIYSALDGMKSAGRIRHIGIATQDLDIARRAAASGLYETLQFPFSMISAEATISLVELCVQNDVGFIAMQPLCGCLVESIPLAFGFLAQYEGVVPLWGVKAGQELEQILYFDEHPPAVDEKFKADVERLRQFFN